MTYLDSLCSRLLSEKYNNIIGEAYQQDCLRLTQGEPYEYVLGWVTFLNTTIDLSLRPMIPRPETAFWVARAIQELKQQSKPLRLADTFSGAGNVGVALLKHLENATVDFSELDMTLAAQIEKNIVLNKLNMARAKILSVSALDGLTGQYDAIFAVPPYVPYEALPELDPEMITYEPHLAFFAHEDGHEFHRLLIAQAWDFLQEGGTLYMEADMDHNDAIRKLVEGTKWSKLEFWSDPYDATPNVVLRK
jgi:release factor glutamine methyltransferase